MFYTTVAVRCSVQSFWPSLSASCCSTNSCGSINICSINNNIINNILIIITRLLLTTHVWMISWAIVGPELVAFLTFAAISTREKPIYTRSYLPSGCLQCFSPLNHASFPRPRNSPITVVDCDRLCLIPGSFPASRQAGLFLCGNEHFLFLRRD